MRVKSDAIAGIYRVGLVDWQLGWVDLDLECSTILLGPATVKKVLY